MKIAFFKGAACAALCVFSLWGNPSTFSLILKPNQPLTTHALQAIPESFLVTRIVTSLPGYTSAEIEYLFSFKPPTLCFKKIFLVGVERLKMQSPASEIEISALKIHDGYELHVAGTQEWTVGRVKYRGMNFAKEEYGVLYDSTPGELFSLERHKEALEAIKKSAQERGYLDTQVDDQLVYHKEDKVVDAYLTIMQKSVYKITTINLAFTGALSRFVPQERDKLYKKFFSGMIKHAYNIKDLESCCKEVKRYLSERGSIGTDLHVQDVIDHEQKTVALTITLGASEQRGLQFFGNHFFSTDQLRAIIMRFGNEAGILPPAVMCQEMQEAYHKKGFWQAHVDTHQDDDADYFIIKEGARARVGKVTILGVQSADHKHIVTTFFKKPVMGKMVDEAVLEDAVDKMIAWYKEHGYSDIELLQKEWKSTKKKDQFDLELVIDEGVCYNVARLRIKDFPEELQDAATALLPVCPFPLSFELLGNVKKTLVHLMRIKGYANAQVTSDMVLTDTDYDVVFAAQPGPLVTVGKIIVSGLTKTKHDVVRSLMATQSGDVWSNDKLPLSFAHLKATDVFERISIQPVYGVHKQERDILLAVQDDEPFEVKVRLGYEQLSKNFAFKKGSSYTGGGTFLWRNPTGFADNILFDVDMSRFERKVGLSYKTPFFISFPMNTTLKTYANRYTQPVAIGSIHPLYNITQEGFLCGLSKHFTHYDCGATVGFEWMLMSDISDQLSRAINFKTNLIGQKIPYFFAEPMVYIDFLDNRLTPTKGTFAALTLKGMFPLRGEGSYFVKGLIENGWFVPLAPLVWATRIRIGHIFKQEFSAVMPSERFYLGGPNSLRGYQVDKCPPLGLFVDDQGKSQWLQQGGKTMLNFNTELRFPLFYKMLQGVLFQDFGILVERPRDLVVFPDKPLAASGFGVRYITPIGPLRFDIGWKWYKDRPDDAAYAWFLTFDHMF